MSRFLNKALTASFAIFCVIGVPHVASSAQTEKWIVLHNKTPVPVLAVYFSETSSDSWGSDFLAQKVIRPDEEREIHINSGSCFVDMKITFTKTIEQTLRFNICTAQHVDSLATGLVVAF